MSRSHRWRWFLKVESFPVYQDGNGVTTAVQSSVNDTTKLSAQLRRLGRCSLDCCIICGTLQQDCTFCFPSSTSVTDSGVSLSRNPTATILLMSSPKRQGSHVKLWTNRNIPSFEVVLVSQCRDTQASKHYFSTMPWAAMLHAEATGARGLALRDKFAITTIPALVLLDGEGVVLCRKAHERL